MGKAAHFVSGTDRHCDYLIDAISNCSFLEHFAFPDDAIYAFYGVWGNDNVKKRN